MKSKQDIYDYLKEKGIRHEITEHAAVFNMEELDSVDLPYPDCDAKNLFLRDDKRRSYFLITVKGARRVDLKEFRKTYGTKPLTFVRPDELAAHDPSRIWRKHHRYHCLPQQQTPDGYSSSRRYAEDRAGQGR